MPIGIVNLCDEGEVRGMRGQWGTPGEMGPRGAAKNVFLRLLSHAGAWRPPALPIGGGLGARELGCIGWLFALRRGVAERKPRELLIATAPRSRKELLVAALRVLRGREDGEAHSDISLFRSP